MRRFTAIRQNSEQKIGHDRNISVIIKSVKESDSVEQLGGRNSECGGIY